MCKIRDLFFLWQVRLWSYNLHTYLTAVDFNWLQIPSTPFNFYFAKNTKSELKLEEHKWLQNRLKRQELCNNNSASSETSSYDQQGKSWSCGMPINPLDVPMLCHALLMKPWTISEALEKMIKHVFILLNFLFSVLYLCDVYHQRNRYIFQESPLEGGYFPEHPPVDCDVIHNRISTLQSNCYHQ